MCAEIRDMKRVYLPLITAVCLLAMSAGCDMPLPVVGKPLVESDAAAIAAGYTPAKIDIMPLTELVPAGSGEQDWMINVYLGLLDSFGSQVKSPGVFRFELYEYVQRSGEPKGRRIAVWPDIDLTDPVLNNNYWRDFLRAYQFALPVEPPATNSYILQATFLSPPGKRLTDEFNLKRTK
jgi:hypothetical protein